MCESRRIMGDMRNIRIGDEVRFIGYPTIYEIMDIDLTKNSQILFKFMSMGVCQEVWAMKCDMVNQRIANGQVFIVNVTSYKTKFLKKHRLCGV